ncbi:MAG: DUF4416 family protein [Candidatus Latescibacterota bacterium]|jgi:hypothetical protein
MPLDLTSARPVAAICAVTAAGLPMLEEATRLVAERLGPVRQRSPAFPFDFSAYYEAEMGPGLVKQLLCLTEPADPSTLPALKRETIALELELAREENGALRRRANLDPGLVSLDSLVLASTKTAGHRICIGPGLYAEVTLLFQGGAYAPLPWSYRDYQAEAAQRFLLETRAWLRGWYRGEAEAMGVKSG